MTATAILAPAPAVPDHGTDPPAHYTCCDPDTAMCGLPLAAGTAIPDDDPTPDCKFCVYVWDENLPCPAPDCPALFGGAP